MNNPLLSFLGITKKSGKIVFGMDSVKKEISNDSVCLLLITSDISENSRKEISDTAINYNVKTLNINFTKDEIESATGKYSAIIGITDENFSKKIVSILVNSTQPQNALKQSGGI